MLMEENFSSQSLLNSVQLGFENFPLRKNVFIVGCTWLKVVIDDGIFTRLSVIHDFSRTINSNGMLD